MEQEFAAVRDGLLGDANLMTLGPPILVNNELVGGTALERTGILTLVVSVDYFLSFDPQHPCSIQYHSAPSAVW